MDTLGSIGTALATPQMIFGIIIGAVFILGGIYALSTRKVSTGGGIATIAVGAGIIFFSWLNRKLVRSSKGYAAYMGARDIFSFLR